MSNFAPKMIKNSRHGMRHPQNLVFMTIFSLLDQNIFWHTYRIYKMYLLNVGKFLDRCMHDMLTIQRIIF